jgi:hypothetical protein
MLIAAHLSAALHVLGAVAQLVSPCAVVDPYHSSQRSEAMRVFGRELSDQSDWGKWRRTPMTWLRLGKRHAEMGHVILSADCFTEVSPTHHAHAVVHAVSAW